MRATRTHIAHHETLGDMLTRVKESHACKTGESVRMCTSVTIRPLRLVRRWGGDQFARALRVVLRVCGGHIMTQRTDRRAPRCTGEMANARTINCAYVQIMYHQARSFVPWLNRVDDLSTCVYVCVCMQWFDIISDGRVA